MERRMWAQALLVWMAALVLLNGCSAPSPGKVATATPLPTLDMEAIKKAAVATMVAQMGTQTAMAQPTSISGAQEKPSTPVPTSTPKPTEEPTAPPASAVNVSIELEGMHYETWGAPVGGCQQFDDSHPMRKFQLQITLYNGTRQKITDWYPEFYANNGRLVLTCFYGYNNIKGWIEVPGGESRTVTFAAFAENNEYIKRMVMKVLGNEFRRCFASSGALVSCP